MSKPDKHDPVLSVASACRIENYHITSIGTVLLACRYIGVHPFQYCREGSA